MSDLNPFADAAFVARVQKLLSMIGSAQPAEAEAARRKLLEHLGSHRLSLTDLAIRLGEAPRPASFTHVGREMQLERQLVIARSAKQEAEADAALSLARLSELQGVLHQANIDMVRIMNEQTRMRGITAAACLVAAVSLIVAALPYVPGDRIARAGYTMVHEGPVTLKSQSQAPPPIRQIRNERSGVVAVQDLAVRLLPNDDAGVRAFLNSGERVLIEDERRVGPQIWLLIRSETGDGWVRSGDIIHDR